ncbi:hypothetical protein DUNSADRAFT_13434 [Dunaliella salina]|uniref:Uncharacterized protein n=1 Tax=Dunaliella salina TaxID=3046 RepID=A0ABQ7G9D9_DUNSA|nr:hypothetical protein DUNSADRAFT_13434 [Dunaliella salina]|eukprot:KAF5831225.1 hypothetical protein DUNSADRAFT_13434 [Dunaliella salina]
MSEALKVAAPKQLVMLGTEGFFGLDDAENKPLNPGLPLCPGCACLCILNFCLRLVHACATPHSQVPGAPAREKDWRLMGWNSYMAFFKVYLGAHTRMAMMLKKPLLLQEFNILLGRFSELERDALFAMAFDEVKVAQRTRGPLVGAMFWNAALRGVHPDTGYNIYFDDTIPQVRGSTAMRLPPAEDPVIAIAYANTTAIVSRSSIISTPTEGALARLTSKENNLNQPPETAIGKDNANGPGAVHELAAPQPPDFQAPSAQQSLAPAPAGLVLQQGGAAASNASEFQGALPQGIGTGLAETGNANNRRRLLQQGKPAGADGFRRAQQRAACAEKEAAHWQPDPQRIDPGNVQALRWLAQVAGLPVLGIIAEAAAALNNYRYN